MAKDEVAVQEPPCAIKNSVDMFGVPPGGFKGKPVYYAELDDVLLYVRYPDPLEKNPSNNPNIAGLSVPAPLRKGAVIATAVKIMKESGLMTCLKDTPDEPLKEPILAERNDTRSANPKNLTAIVFVSNRQHEGEPYFLIWTNVFRADGQFMTPGALDNWMFSHAIFFVGKSDEEIQKELEIALSRIGL